MAFIKKGAAREISNLGVMASLFEDEKTGAMHLHLASDTPENSFLVAFPTIPGDDSGAAHILEHMALCGSQKYPCRDPFFSMLKRSVASFMNAMTYPDRTVYPFASENPTDFFNLLDVYLDAAFFPKLEKADFLQEGWRIDAQNPDAPGIQGVVFNEMKGAMSSPDSVIHHCVSANCASDTPYKHNSGGDPDSIPTLSHEDLVAFHKRHYHPSQAWFMTFGDADPVKIQDAIQEKVLSRFDGKEPRVVAPVPALPSSNASFENPYPSSDLEAGHALTITWNLGSVTDSRRAVEAALLEHLLLSDSSSPVVSAIERLGLGRLGMAGLDSSGNTLFFHIGVEGLSEAQVPLARKAILGAVEACAKKGFDKERLANKMRDFRISQLEISSGHQPYGLGLLLACAPVAMHGGDPVCELDSLPALAALEAEISRDDKAGAFLAKRLVDLNRVETISTPDPEWFEKLAVRESETAAKITAGLKAAGLFEASLLEIKEMEEKQKAPNDTSVLPGVKVSDIPFAPRAAKPIFQENGLGAFAKATTNGISYLSVSMAHPEPSSADAVECILLGDLLLSCGVADMDWEAAETWRQGLCSGSRSSVSQGAVAARPHDCVPVLRLDAKCPVGAEAKLVEALRKSAFEANFSDRERLRYLVGEMASSVENDAASSGGEFAKACAASFLGSSGSFGMASTLEYARRLQSLAKEVISDEGADALAKRLNDTLSSFLCGESRVMTITSGDEKSFASMAGSAFPLAANSGATPYSIPPSSVGTPVKRALSHPGSVNHSHVVWEGPDQTHPDAPSLAVLAAILKNSFLHTALRERGGAYGAMASSSGGSFSMGSYRDPRLAGTFDDFAKAEEWLASGEFSPDMIEEAVISTIRSMDKPPSPRGDAGASFARSMAGIDAKTRESFRKGVLSCDKERLVGAAIRWIVGKPRSACSFVGEGFEAEAASLGMDIEKLLPHAAKTPSVRP